MIDYNNYNISDNLCNIITTLSAGCDGQGFSSVEEPEQSAGAPREQWQITRDNLASINWADSGRRAEYVRLYLERYAKLVSWWTTNYVSLDRIRPCSTIIDIGCGPGSAVIGFLDSILQRNNHQVINKVINNISTIHLVDKSTEIVNFAFENIKQLLTSFEIQKNIPIKKTVIDINVANDITLLKSNILFSTNMFCELNDTGKSKLKKIIKSPVSSNLSPDMFFISDCVELVKFENFFLRTGVAIEKIKYSTGNNERTNERTFVYISKN
jgi:hypothetical protein